MKKFLSVLLVLVMIFTLAACGQKEEAQTQDPVEEAWVPKEPITLVVHNAAGSGTDVVYRAWAAAAEKTLGVSVVINNIGGGAFVPAMQEIANAAKDGYTIGCITESPYYSAGYMGGYDEYGVNLQNDLDILCQGVKNFNMLAVPDDAPYNTMKEFIDYCKNNPSENITLGQSGTGGIHDITIKAFAKAAGLSNITAVAFDGSANSAAAVAGDKITGHVAGYSPNRALLESGDLKVIGTFKEGKDRDTRFPDWESANEIGLDVTGLQIWGIACPAGTPANVEKALTEAFQKALDDADFKAVIEKQGMLIEYLDAATYEKKLDNVYDTAIQFAE